MRGICGVEFVVLCAVGNRGTLLIIRTFSGWVGSSGHGVKDLWVGSDGITGQKFRAGSISDPSCHLLVLIRHAINTGSCVCVCLLWPPYVIGVPLYFCPVISFLLSSFFFLA